MMRRLTAAFLVLALAGAAAPEPDGFRMDHYRGDVPATLHGARVIDTAALAKLIAGSRPVLVDVLPAPAPPPDARPGLPRMALPHRDIPGSLWLADTGRGALAPALETQFKAELATATAGDTSRPVVFYCLAHCWMSWNAAKRAVQYGYRNVVWYPDGVDGWQAAGFATVAATPKH